MGRKNNSKEEHTEHLKKLFGENYVEENRKRGMEKSLRRALLQLLDMVNDVESIIYDCIEAEIEVETTDALISAAENKIKEACLVMGITIEELNTKRYEYFEYTEEEAEGTVITKALK